MKKGFTMIELIFVIVILGILAAVAIPRLTATRDDAEVAKAATNMTTIISDISGYYTSQGEFAESIGAMTNVQVANETGDASAVGGAATAELQAAGNSCLTMTLTPYNSTTKKPATLRFEAEGEGVSMCDKIHENAGVKKVLEGTFVYKADDGAGNVSDETSEEGEIAISGIGVKF